MGVTRDDEREMLLCRMCGTVRYTVEPGKCRKCGADAWCVLDTRIHGGRQ